MSEISFHDENHTTVVTHPNWGAIWAGVFTFFAIWCVFGLLGISIFANRNATTETVGMGIWAVILTIIAMYVAGRATGHLARIGNSRDGLIHGVVMFGLTVVGALAITMLAANSITVAGTDTVAARSPYLLGMFADLGWFGFLSLFFGWLAAMGGASAGTHIVRTSIQQVSQAH